jgi:transcriptional regulator with XRE-family HTH domain
MGSFPEELQRLLRERGWNQSQAAAHLDISQGLISAYLRGEREPTLSTLLQIASRMDIRVGRLVGDENAQQPSNRQAQQKGLPRVAGHDDLCGQALKNLKTRWKKKPSERDTIKHLIAALFGKDSDRVLGWLNQSSQIGSHPDK